MGMADAWFGYFRITGKTFLSGARESVRLSKFFLLLLSGTLCALAYHQWRSGSRRERFVTAAAIVYVTIQLAFIYHYRDVANNERFDFILFWMPFAFYPIRKSASLPFLLGIVVIFYLLVGTAFFLRGWS